MEEMEMHTTTYEAAETFVEFTSTKGNRVKIKNLAFEGGDYSFYAKIRKADGEIIEGAANPGRPPAWTIFGGDPSERYVNVWRVYSEANDKTYTIQHPSAGDAWEAIDPEIFII